MVFSTLDRTIEAYLEHFKSVRDDPYQGLNVANFFQRVSLCVCKRGREKERKKKTNRTSSIRLVLYQPQKDGGKAK